MSELHEEMRRLYLAGLEDAAQMAEQRKGETAEMIAKAIRDKIATIPEVEP